MTAFFAWVILLAVNYDESGGNLMFKILLWGGIGLLVLGLLASLYGGDKKKEDIREYRQVYHRKTGRAGEAYIYLSVYFQTRGNWYYYLTEDDSIQPNDVVVVPWGKWNRQELAIVGWVEHRTEADAPFPLSRTKYIIRKASPESRYAFDEMIRWPLEVNISCRWTRDEEGNGFQVVNDREERNRLRNWISKNPRLRPVERMVPGYMTKEDKFWDAVR